MAIPVTDALLRAIATKDKQITDGQKVAKSGAYVQSARLDDWSLVRGQCQGSALCSVSVDLDHTPPVVRCTCPVKPPPCKHALGLLSLAL